MADDVSDLHVSKSAQGVQEVHLEQLTDGCVEAAHVCLQDSAHRGELESGAGGDVRNTYALISTFLWHVYALVR